MGSKGWIKRVLPFFATFAVGIFIASFFVSAGPRWGGHGRWRMRAEMERLRSENDELRDQNLRLRNNCPTHNHDMDLEMNVPEVQIPYDAPLPPPPPMPHRPPRHDR